MVRLRDPVGEVRQVRRVTGHQVRQVTVPQVRRVMVPRVSREAEHQAWMKLRRAPQGQEGLVHRAAKRWVLPLVVHRADRLAERRVGRLAERRVERPQARRVERLEARQAHPRS
jgi:hypothetical protein